MDSFHLLNVGQQNSEADLNERVRMKIKENGSNISKINNSNTNDVISCNNLHVNDVSQKITMKNSKKAGI